MPVFANTGAQYGAGRQRSLVVLFYALATLFGGGALFSWLVLPMRRVPQFLGLPNGLAEKQALFMVVTLAGAVLCCLFAQVLQASGGTSPSSKKASEFNKQKFWLLAIGGACVLLWLRVCFQIGNTSLNWDEMSYLKELTGPRWLLGLNPLQIGNHWWTQLINFISMKLFGVSEVSGRLSAVLFSGCFLTLLFLFLRKQASNFTCLLVVVHLATSAVFEWHAHSSRGYISLMFATLILFSMLVDFTRSPNWPRKKTVGFALAVVFAFGSHGMSSLFVALTCLALLLYLYANRASLSDEKRTSGLQLIAVGAGMLFLFSPMFYFHVVEGANYIAESTPSMFPMLLSGPFGLGRAWMGKLAFLSVLIFLVLGYRSQKKEFAYWFVLGSVVFFVSVLWAMGKYLFSPRFLMPFVLPFVFWFGQGVSSLDRVWIRKLAMVWVLVLFGVVPKFYHSEHATTLSTNLTGFTNFVNKVRKITYPVEKNCYHFAGYEGFVVSARDFYFRSARGNRVGECEKRYLLVFGWEHTHKSLPNEAHWNALNGPPIFRDKLRALYEIPMDTKEDKLTLAKY